MCARRVAGPEAGAFENYRDGRRKKGQSSLPRPEPDGSIINASPRADRGERPAFLKKDSMT